MSESVLSDTGLALSFRSNNSDASKQGSELKQYEKTLFNMCYLLQLQMGVFFKQQEFDEIKFCRNYLKLYKRLRNLDSSLSKLSEQHTKFSSAFTDFTILVYHNMFGPNGIIDTNKPPKQWTKSREGSARKVTFADDTEESIIKSVASTTGLPKIDEDSDNEETKKERPSSLKNRSPSPSNDYVEKQSTGTLNLPKIPSSQEIKTTQPSSAKSRFKDVKIRKQKNRSVLRNSSQNSSNRSNASMSLHRPEKQASQTNSTKSFNIDSATASRAASQIGDYAGSNISLTSGRATQSRASSRRLHDSLLSKGNIQISETNEPKNSQVAQLNNCSIIMINKNYVQNFSKKISRQR